MSKRVFAVALVAAAGCAKQHAPAPAPIPAVTIDQVDHALAAGQVQPVDCNTAATREHEGVLPGAVLLTDEATYKVSELPADKARPLVFYCANRECSASHEAAARAVTAGYTHVEVMPDGIAGWVTAGKKTQRI